MTAERLKAARDAAVVIGKRMTELVRGLTQLRTSQMATRPAPDVRRDLSQIERDQKALDEQLSTLRDRMTTAQVNLAKLQGKRDKLRDDENGLRDEQSGFRKELDRVSRLKNCPTCKGKIAKEWRIKEEKRLLAEAESIRSELDKLLSTQTENARKIREQTKVIADAKKTLTETMTKRDGVVAAYNRLIKEMKETTSSSDDKAKEQQALAERARADATVKMAKAALSEVQRIQASIVATAFEKFLSVANRLTANILPSPLIFQDGIIGRMRNGRFIPHSGFTTAEEAIALSGISMALSTQSPFKLMLIDDLSLVDPDNMTTLMVNIDTCLKDGLIDQFIGADTREDLGWGGGAKEVVL